MQELKEHESTEEELRVRLLKAEEVHEDYRLEIKKAREGEEEDERMLYQSEVELEQMKNACRREDGAIIKLLDEKACILTKCRQRRADFLLDLTRQSKENNSAYEEETESIHYKLRQQMEQKKGGDKHE